MSVLYVAAVTAFAVVAVLLIGLVLVQKSAASRTLLGGTGGGSLFGSRLPTVLTWATASVFGAFVLLAVLLNLIAA